MASSPTREEASAADRTSPESLDETGSLTSHVGDEGVCSHVPLDAETGRLIGVIQLVLAEKRTSLAVLRTGVTIALVPLSITTVLVTLSRFYDWVANLHFLVPMYAILTALTLLSLYLIVRAVLRIRREDRIVDEFKQSYPDLAPFIY